MHVGLHVSTEGTSRTEGTLRTVRYVGPDSRFIRAYGPYVGQYRACKGFTLHASHAKWGQSLRSKLREDVGTVGPVQLVGTLGP